jgi:very-short-patch-repair endonuclease
LRLDVVLEAEGELLATVTAVQKKQYPSKHMVRRARDLRQTGTSPEQLLWTALRNGQIGGLKFRRQQPVGPYVVDFYCHSIKLVVEVDGMSHDDKTVADKNRTAFLERQGLRVLRVTNEDVMRDLEAVARRVAQLGGVAWD